MANSYFNLNDPEKSTWSLREKLKAALASIAGYDLDILRKHCPSFELNVAIAIGCVAVVGAVFNTGIFTLAGHLLFGSGHFNLLLAGAGIILALMIATVESYGGRALHMTPGAAGLKRGGLAFARLQQYTASLSTFGAYRAGIALLTALVTTTGISLGLYAPDIAAKVSRDTRDGNHAIYQQADRAYEQEQRHLSDAETGQSALVSNLEREVTRLRREVVRKSVSGTRRAAGTGSTGDNAQLEKFEKKLADEQLKLTNLRDQSLKKVEGRNATIARMIATSPEKAVPQEGLIGRLSALHSLMIENPSVLIVVIAIDLLLAALDCAGLIVRLCAPTPNYSEFVAKTSILVSVAQAKDCADQLAVYQREEEKPGAVDGKAEQADGTAPPNPPGGQPMPPGPNGEVPPHKGPGRPKGSKTKKGKNGLDPNPGEASHG
jgi:uncharacterized protein DUF4407